MSDITDWISAGANAAAAVGTVGALWVGAVTLRRQVNDQHRAQAAAVTVTIQTVRHNQELLEFAIRNDSPLPIYEVILIAEDAGKDAQQTFIAAMPPGTSERFQLRDITLMGCRAAFYDSSRKRWVRDFTGQLRDITPKPPNRLKLLYRAITTSKPK